MATRMLQRRGTAAEWAALNPILEDGELGFERDTKIIKIGDGVTAWNNLVMGWLPVGGGLLTGPLIIPGGSPAEPSLQFEDKTGLYQAAPGTLSWVVSAVSQLVLETAKLRPTTGRHNLIDLGDPAAVFRRIFMGDGSAALPAYAFGANSTTGFYRTVNGVGVAIGGVVKYELYNNDLAPGADNAQALGWSGRRYTALWATNGVIQTSDLAEKRDVIRINGTEATDRVLKIADAAIQYKWNSGQRQHAGFDAESVGQIVGTDHAAYIDPAINAQKELEVGPPTELYDVPDHIREIEDVDVRHSAEVTLVEERIEAWRAQKEEELAAPKGLIYNEMLPDLYVAFAQQQALIETLEARIAQLEA